MSRTDHDRPPRHLESLLRRLTPSWSARPVYRTSQRRDGTQVPESVRAGSPDGVRTRLHLDSYSSRCRFQNWKCMRVTPCPFSPTANRPSIKRERFGDVTGPAWWECPAAPLWCGRREGERSRGRDLRRGTQARAPARCSSHSGRSRPGMGRVSGTWIDYGDGSYPSPAW
jgi:hypothetical protein